MGVYFRLEEKRKVKSKAYYARKLAFAKKLGDAQKSTTTNKEELANLGF